MRLYVFNFFLSFSFFFAFFKGFLLMGVYWVVRLRLASIRLLGV